MLKARHIVPVLALALALVAAAGAGSAHALGGITQLPPPFGCLEPGGPAPCGSVRALLDPYSILVSPDGRHAYASGFSSHAVGVFDRNVDSGGLTQKAGAAGCVSLTGAEGCAGARAIASAYHLAMSPDGSHLYVPGYSSDAVAVFDRDAATGALSQKTGTDGCIAESPTGANDTCEGGRALMNPYAIAVSPDGKNVYVASYTSDAISVLRRNADGTLDPVPGPGGCVARASATLGPCSEALRMDGPYDVAVSVDGKSVRVVTGLDHAVLSFARDADTGALTQVAASDGGCWGYPVTADGCKDDTGLSGNFSLAISPDGGLVYVGSSGRITVFRSLASGGLERLGCTGAPGTAGCTPGRTVNAPYVLAVSPGGGELYVPNSGADTLTVYELGSDGSIVSKAGASGCAALVAQSECSLGEGLDGPTAVAASADGRHVYAVATDRTTTAGEPARDAVVSFRRDARGPTCSNGSATVPTGTLTQLGLDCSDADGDPVAISIASAPSGGVLGAIDQATRQVPFIPNPGFAGSTSFTFKATAAGVQSAPANFTLDVRCIAKAEVVGNGADEDCDGRDLAVIRATLARRWYVPPRRRHTLVRVLRVNNVPAGATVTVTCRRRGCPPRRRLRPINVAADRKSLDLRKLLFRKRKLQPKTVLEITITAPGTIGKRYRFTMRPKRKLPREQSLCLFPGAAKPAACP